MLSEDYIKEWDIPGAPRDPAAEFFVQNQKANGKRCPFKYMFCEENCALRIGPKCAVYIIADHIANIGCHDHEVMVGEESR